MKVRLLSLLAGMMMSGSASIAGGSEPATLDESQMDAVTAGHDTLDFTFNDNSCAGCTPMEWLMLMDRQGIFNFNFIFNDDSCAGCTFNF